MHEIIHKGLEGLTLVSKHIYFHCLIQIHKKYYRLGQQLL